MTRLSFLAIGCCVVIGGCVSIRQDRIIQQDPAKCVKPGSVAECRRTGMMGLSKEGYNLVYVVCEDPEYIPCP